jgi:sulfur carrier protein
MSATATTSAVLVNDQQYMLQGPETLGGLLRRLGHSGIKGVAAAVNGAVVPKSGWELQALSDGDRILVIRATQGG